MIDNWALSLELISLQIKYWLATSLIASMLLYIHCCCVETVLYWYNHACNSQLAMHFSVDFGFQDFKPDFRRCVAMRFENCSPPVCW